MGIISSGKLNPSVMVDDAYSFISFFDDLEKTSFVYRERDYVVVKNEAIKNLLFTSIDNMPDIFESMGIVSLREPYNLDFPAVEVVDLSLKNISYLNGSIFNENEGKKAYLFGIRKDERKVPSSLKKKKFEEALNEHKKKNGEELFGALEKKELKKSVNDNLLKKAVPVSKIVECLLVPDDGVFYVFASGKLLEEISTWLMSQVHCILDIQPLLQWRTKDVVIPSTFMDISTACSPETLTHNFLMWMLYNLYKNEVVFPENLQPAGSFTLQREKDLKTTVQYGEDVYVTETLLQTFLQPFKSENCKIISGKFNFLVADCFQLSFLIKGDLNDCPVLLCSQYDKILKVLNENTVVETGEFLENDEIAENTTIRYFLMQRGYDTCKTLLELYISDKNRNKSECWI